MANLKLSANRFAESQAIVDSFWKRWLKKYIPSLVERKKWMDKQRIVTVGDLVLIVDQATQRGRLPLGTVIKLLPTKLDQEVRK